MYHEIWCWYNDGNMQHVLVSLRTSLNAAMQLAATFRTGIEVALHMALQAVDMHAMGTLHAYEPAFGHLTARLSA